MKSLDKYLSLLGMEVDGILLTSRYSRHYSALYDIAEGVALVTKEGCRYFTDSRYIEAARAHIRGFDVLEVTRQEPYNKRINDALSALHIQRLGYEDRYLTVSELHAFQQELQAELVPMGDSLDRFRAVKEDWELDRMRKAQQITDVAFAQILPKIRAGITERDLQAELIYALYQNGGEGLAFDPIVVSGPNTSLPHGVAGNRVICPGDFVTLDFGATYGGYCSDMTRTVAVGYATEKMKQVYGIVLAAQQAGIAVSRAGVTGAQIDEAARKVIADAGYGPYFGHGYGHSLGMECHEWPSCSPSGDTPMQAGMIASAEPGIYLPGEFGVRIEDVVVFTPDGCEILTKSPKNLIIV